MSGISREIAIAGRITSVDSGSGKRTQFGALSCNLQMVFVKVFVSPV